MRALVLAGAALVALLTAGVGALYAYDASRADLIAKGITVMGVNVGGMEPAEARALIRRRIAARLARPLLLKHGGRPVTLVSPQTAQVRVDVDAMVGAAVERSRRGTFLSRAYRELTGGALKGHIPLRVTYSREAVAALVSRVERRLSRAPRTARIVPSPTALHTVTSKNGLAVKARSLERRIVSELVRLRAERLVEVPTRVVRPRVTTAELRSSYPYFITIGRPRFELRLFARLRLVKIYRISVGRIGYETPVGLYHIKSKASNPAWYVPNKTWAGELAGKIVPPGPDNPIKARWMGIYDGAGIHGTDDVGSIGHPASHGCIRMRVPDVIELYNRVPLHTPVYIG